MIIKPAIRSNIAITAHPIGCKQNILDAIEELKDKESIDCPKNILIVGGSSGYGLASRIALAFKGNANTINVSYESGPKGKRTGSAGYWNNLFFQQEADKIGVTSKDFLGDAFSIETKETVINYIKEEFGGKIDLLIYSLASGVRVDPQSGIMYKSSLKATGKAIDGKSINFAKSELFDQHMDVATEQEIADTVKVMGGEDWSLWIDMLKESGVLENNFKTVAYSYLGAESTYPIYRDGTIGHAKEHIENTCSALNDKLSSINGEALISLSKAVATKASSFIPIFPIYGAALFKVMKEMNLHESTTEHKYRLFKEMIYGDNRELDEKGRLRPDAWELREDVQEATTKIMNSITDENFLEIADGQEFIKDFYKLNGFMVDGIDYDAEVDLEELSSITLK